MKGNETHPADSMREFASYCASVVTEEAGREVAEKLFLLSANQITLLPVSDKAELERCLEVICPPGEIPEAIERLQSLDWEPKKDATIVRDESGNFAMRRFYDTEMRIAKNIKRLNDYDSVVGKRILKNPDDFAEACLGPGVFVMTGGPGTGKTTQIANIVAKFIANDRLMNAVLYSAPTGKAASRLYESLTEKLTEMGLDPSQGVSDYNRPATLHSRLYSNKAPLKFAQCVIVDEASMVDLAIADQLLEKIPNGSTVILIGDSNQLSSVEVGSVFADLVSFFRDHLPHRFFELKKNHRSIQSLRTLADVVLSGDLTNFVEEAGKYFEPIKKPDQVCEELINNKKNMLSASPREYLGGTILLSPNRVGYWGSESLNRLCVNQFSVQRQDRWFEGRQIIVTVNSAILKNGDIGVSKVDRRVVFPGLPALGNGQGDLELSPTLLPPHEDAFALTIHKSQGSEFDNVFVVLPPGLEKISKQMIYTAITRAKNNIRFYGVPGILDKIKLEPSFRLNGLRSKLNLILGRD